MPLPDPREDWMNLIKSLAPPLVEVFAEGTYYRFYLNPKDTEKMVVVAVAKAHISSFAMLPDKYGYCLRPPIKPSYTKALFLLANGELAVKGGTWCAVRLDKGQVVETIGDCPDIRWNKKKCRKRGGDEN